MEFDAVYFQLIARKKRPKLTSGLSQPCPAGSNNLKKVRGHDKIDQKPISAEPMSKPQEPSKPGRRVQSGRVSSSLVYSSMSEAFWAA